MIFPVPQSANEAPNEHRPCLYPNSDSISDAAVLLMPASVSICRTVVRLSFRTISSILALLSALLAVEGRPEHSCDRTTPPVCCRFVHSWLSICLRQFGQFPTESCQIFSRDSQNNAAQLLMSFLTQVFQTNAKKAQRENACQYMYIWRIQEINPSKQS